MDASTSVTVAAPSRGLGSAARRPRDEIEPVGPAQLEAVRAEDLAHDLDRVGGSGRLLHGHARLEHRRAVRERQTRLPQLVDDRRDRLPDLGIDGLRHGSRAEHGEQYGARGGRAPHHGPSRRTLRATTRR